MSCPRKSLRVRKPVLKMEIWRAIFNSISNSSSSTSTKNNQQRIFDGRFQLRLSRFSNISCLREVIYAPIEHFWKWKSWGAVFNSIWILVCPLHQERNNQFTRVFVVHLNFDQAAVLRMLCPRKLCTWSLNSFRNGSPKVRLLIMFSVLVHS